MSPRWCVVCAAVVALVCVDAPVAGDLGSMRRQGHCAARTDGSPTLPIDWHVAADDRQALDRWCRGVGPPVAVSVAAGTAPPSLDELVVVTWNAHLAEGRLNDLIEALRAGRLTGGRPVAHFVLLLQELYRRGDDVPPFEDGARTAFAIRARRVDALDAKDYARTLGLSFVYVPSMRNGAAFSEDRGNVIVSTEPLDWVRAIELPLERQRRVSIETSIEVRTDGSVRQLQLIDVHLEPLSSPSTLWLFRNPRLRQLDALLRVLRTRSRFASGEAAAGFVLGGDFNLIQGGADEPVYSVARVWSRDLDVEDPRGTHRMGRLDYLFFRNAGSPGETLSTMRIDDRFGSDHHPVMGRFSVP